jgi:DNA polymerase III delta prime subunit
MGILDQVTHTSPPRHPKVLLWGRPGLGKTVTALWIARECGLRILGIDADGGLGVYRNAHESDGSRTWPEMDTLEMSDPIATTQAVGELLSDTRKWGMFLVDPISMLFRSAEAATDATARQKKNVKSSTRVTEYETAMGLQERQNMNRIGFLLVRDLWRLQMPVIVTAREKSEWRDQKVVGVVPMAPDGFDHEFDIVVRLVRTVDAGTTFCYVQKDRLRRLPSVVEMAPGDPFGLARALVTSYGPLWSLGVATNPRCSDEQVDEIRTMQVAAGITGKQMALVLSRDFGVQEVADLRPEQAVALCQRLAAKAAAATNPTNPTNQPQPQPTQQGN